MKLKYKGLDGIAALRQKRIDEKKKAIKKNWQEKTGVVSQICRERNDKGNRRERRRNAKLFIKNPLDMKYV